MKRTHIILLIFLAVVMAVIILMMGDYSSYANFEQAAQAPNKEFHIAGELVKEKGMEYNPQQNADVFSFYFRDRDGNEHKVIANTDKPQDFELANEIVLIGKMDGDVFYAEGIQTKCPSKYTDAEIAIKEGE